MINPRMRGITFDQLRTFSEVVERASFTTAGDHLGLSQPAVSQQIRLLEKRFGVRLIERVGRKARPTSAGAVLLSYARMILDAMASAETEMAPYVKGTMGKVRIGAGATVSIYFLPAVLRMLRRRFDGLEIFVTTGTVSDVLRQIEDNALDLGLVTLRASLGVTVLAALLAGVVIGGLILTLSTVLPLRQRLRRAGRTGGSTLSVPPADEGQ